MASRRLALVLAVASVVLPAAEHHGRVRFGGQPVPGAMVTANQGDQTLTTITDPEGRFSFADLPDGTWTIQVEMSGFETIRRDLAIAREAPGLEWELELKMLPLKEIEAVSHPASAAPPPASVPTGQTAAPSRKAKKGAAPPSLTNTETPFQRAELNAANRPPSEEAAVPGGDAATSSQNVSELSQRAADGLLINGTANNGASSQFAITPAFGNNRRGPRSLYNGNLGVILDTSALDARPFSLTGQDTPRPGYDHIQGVFAFGGPVKVPGLLARNGPNFFVNYQWTRNRTATTETGLVPTDAERNGDFSQVLGPFLQPVQVADPVTGTPFAGNRVPQTSISPQAKALLGFYPEPNFAGSTQYNYQIPITTNTHQDSLQSRVNKTIGRKHQVSATFAFESTRTDNPNLFGFLDTHDSLGLNFNGNWRHNFTPRFFMNLGFQYSRLATRLTPYFENRTNVSGAAGIRGNNQEPVDWGPPGLTFASGISPLADGLPSFTRNQTSGVSIASLWNRGRHNVSFGGDFRRQQFNVFAQQDPRGTFTFTGRAAGYDFAGFLLGVADTSSIAFGNPDKYFRASSYDAYITDDFRMSPGFTLNAGIRWEYWSPLTELYGRLVNLDIAPGFTAERPVVASDPTGPLTGQKYPDSLLQPDKRAFQPRIGFSWRPLAASSMVVRGGYGVYYNTSVYLPLAIQMAQQAPLSKSLSIESSPTNPLRLANAFTASPSITPDTFAVDPNFVPGYAQNWQLSVQRDLPGSLVIAAIYQGSKGTRAVEEFLPNTFPDRALDPCPGCPTGFTYLASNGNSTREAGQIQLRRRLHNGFTANLEYTFAKAIDDAALGGKNQGTAVIAQNWLDLSGERALSVFDQRHLLTAQLQYTTGMGIGGGTLVNGWRGSLFKGWTFVSTTTVGSGLPLTPTYPTPVRGTGVTSSVRPDYTGAPLYAAPPGLSLNPRAYAPPAAGQWGNAGRDSITGPSQLLLNASLGRIFQISDRLNLDLRVDLTNALNHVTFPSWNTAVTSAQFGLPTSANAMRSLQTVVRLRF